MNKYLFDGVPQAPNFCVSMSRNVETFNAYSKGRRRIAGLGTRMNQLLDSSKRHDDVDIGKEEQPKILSQTLMIIPLGCRSSEAR